MLSRFHQLPALVRRTSLQFTTYRRTLSTPSAKRQVQCPKCHSTLPTPLPACPKCSYISRVPSNIKYHEMFDLPSANNPFKVDDKQLSRRFRKLQQTVHPDAWSAKGEVRVGTNSKRSDLTRNLGPDAGGIVCCCGPIFLGESRIQDSAKSSVADGIHPPGARYRSC